MPYPTGWRVLENTSYMSVEEVVRALGYHASGRISHSWTGLHERHELYKKPVYAEAFKEWRRRLSVHLALGRDKSKLEKELDRQQEELEDEQDLDRAQKELDMFLEKRDRQVKSQEIYEAKKQKGKEIG